MVTVHREAGMRFVIFTDDHEPVHVHVFGDGEAKIELFGPTLVHALDMKAGDVRKAMRIVAGQQAFLLKRWNDIHG